MRTIIRNNYAPRIGDYHETIVRDEMSGGKWIFDCDGVYTMFENKVVDEEGDSAEWPISQRAATDGLNEVRAGVATVSGRVSGMQADVAEAKAKSSEAKEESATAIAVANSTKEEIDEAKAQSDEAKAEAIAAQSQASVASAAAAAAQTSANTAQASANAAQDSADAAQDAADTAQDAADTLAQIKADKSDTYTKAEVDGKLTSAMHYKGTVATTADLPSDAEVGDVYNVEADGTNYAWDGTTWDRLSGIVDLSNYYTKTQSDGLLEAKADQATTYTKTEVDTAVDSRVPKVSGGDEGQAVGLVSDGEGGTTYGWVNAGDTVYDENGVNITNTSGDEIIIGRDSTIPVQGVPAIAIGYKATAKGNAVSPDPTGSVAIGKKAFSYSLSTALGEEARANGIGTTTIGALTTAYGEVNTAIGYGSSTTMKNGLPLRTGEVSFGNAADPTEGYQSRYLANVRAGELDTDAVNVAQLNAAVGDIDTLLQALNTGVGV